MPHPQIKFGTDGWRAVIADDFTFANVRIAAEAIAAYIHARKCTADEDPARRVMCIGYDTRFGSRGLCARLRRGRSRHRHPGDAGQRRYAHSGAQFRRSRARAVLAAS
jgi:phosphomannomutase